MGQNTFDLHVRVLFQVGADLEAAEKVPLHVHSHMYTLGNGACTHACNFACITSSTADLGVVGYNVTVSRL